jgi:hypothetical protein
MKNAKCEMREDGGFQISISAVNLSGGELKRTLDASMFRGDYSVRV